MPLASGLARQSLFLKNLAMGLSAGLALGVLALSAFQTRSHAAGYRWDLPQGFPTPRVPSANPMSEAKVRLGRYLFYDQRLSGNGSQSCASCHRQELAFTDGRRAPVGSTGEAHSRSAMSLVNVAYSSVLTWSDPGLRTLEDQALVPLLSEHPVEMGVKGHEDAVLATLRAAPVYVSLFREAFPEAFPRSSGSHEDSGTPFTLQNVAKALAAFERSILSARSPWDRFHHGDADAISEAAKRGEVLFFTDGLAGCFRCHGGFNFSDATDFQGNTRTPAEFHNTGLYNLPGALSYPAPNLGIYSHTARAADIGKFKTPTLRNIQLTAPYMHDGSIATLDEVLDHYTAGGRTIERGPFAGAGRDNPHKDRRITGFTLTAQQREDLLAFLRSLTDGEVIRDPRFSNPW